MAHPEHGYDVMKRVADTLADISKIEMPQAHARDMLAKVRGRSVRAGPRS